MTWEAASLSALQACLRRQAAVNLCNHAGDTALHVLVAEGPLGTEAMQLLLGAGADPNIMNATGELPAHGFSRRVSRDAPILLKIIPKPVMVASFDAPSMVMTRAR